jgi:PAS domain S-box-containing protein
MLNEAIQEYYNQIPNFSTLEQFIDLSPVKLTPDSLVMDALSLMSQVRSEGCALADGVARPSGLSLPAPKTNSCTLVMEGSQVAGIFTERDVVRLVASGIDLAKLQISAVMTQPVISLRLSEDQNVVTALALMRQHQIRHLPVVDEQGHLVGLITQDRLYQAMESLPPSGAERVNPFRQATWQSPGEEGIESPAGEALQLTQEGQEYVWGFARHISEGQQAEKALREQKSCLRLALDAAQMGSWECNSETGQVIWSERTEAIFGFAPGTFPGDRETYFQLVHPEDRASVAQAIARSYAERSPYHAEFRIQRRDGTIGWVAAWAAVFQREPEQSLWMSGVVLAITERKQTEALLQHQAQREQSLNRVIQAIRQSLNLEAIFATATAEIGQLLQVDQVEIVQYLPERQMWLNVAEYRHSPNSLSALGAEIPDRGNPIAAQIKQGKIIRVNDTSQCKDEINRAFAQTYPGAWSIVPLQNGSRVWGSLSLHYCDRPWPWQDSEVELARAVAGQLAIAIHQAELYQQLQRELIERQRAETVLREREQFLRSIYHNAHQGIFALDVLADGDFQYVGVNPAYERLTGISTELLRDQRPEQVFPPAIAAAVRQNYNHCVEAGTSITYEEYMPFQGQELWWFTSLTPLRDEAGRIFRLVGTSTNITELKHTEAALRQSEARFRTLSTSAPIGIYQTDAEGRYLYTNPRWQEITGLTWEESLGDGWVRGLHPEDREMVLTDWNRYAHEGSQFSIEFRFLKPRGDVRWVLGRAIAIRSGTGEISGHVGVNEDITDRKKAEEALRESEQRLQAILDNSPAVIYLIDRQNRHLLVSRSYAELLSETPAKLVGKSIYEVWPTQIADAFAVNNRKVLQGSQLLETEEVAPKADGLHTYITLKCPLDDAEGKPYAVCGISTDITERKRAEEALRSSEARANSLTNDVLDKSAVGIFILDADFRVVWLNQALEKFFGLRREDVIGQDKRQLIRGPIAQILEEPESFTNSVLATYDNNTYIENFECHVLPNGSREERWLEHLSQPILSGFYAGGRIEHYTDITQRKRAEEALCQSEATLRSFFNSASMMMGIVELVDGDMSMVSCNLATAKFFGTTPETIQQHLAGEMGTSELYWRDWRDRYLEAQRTQLPVHFVYLHETAQGQQWLSATVCSIPEQSGEYPRFAFVVEDITERKQAEEKIRQQAALIDIATDAIFVRDLENHILFWNQGAERLYGWAAAETLGKTARKLFHQESPSQRSASLQTTIEKGSWQGELQQVKKDGTEIVVASRWTLVRDRSGQPQSILVVNTDITEKKQLEQQFYRAQRLESLGTLASGIAHDLNNIFTPILGIAQLLPLKLPELDGRTQELLETLEDSAKRGANMVKQILTFARGAEGKRISLQVEHILLEVAKIARQTFPKSIDICTDIPARTLSAVRADATQVHQVFMNLAVNARDAMPHGGILNFSAENCFFDGIYARMHLDAQEGNYVAVTVSDTGMGIPPEQRERIFEPFFTTKDLGKGTGLGLSTVLGIVKSHGGFLQVLSEVGKGTQFKVYLPATETTSTQPSAEEQLLRGNGELILLVDDEAAVQQITKASLEEYNYRTLVANDGIEAIALYAKYQKEISVVLMDLMMPNMDGLTAIRTLQKMNPQVKIIATSGLSANTQQVISAGVKAFLSKPYTAKELLHPLSALIAR